MNAFFSLFSNFATKNTASAKISKHQASKKNFKHVKNLSRGEKNHQAFNKQFTNLPAKEILQAIMVKLFHKKEKK